MNKNQTPWRVHGLVDKCDPSIPHITCLLANEAPLKDNILSTAELWVILLLTFARLAREEYKHHQTVPVSHALFRGFTSIVLANKNKVTVISTAGTRLRIAQGNIDSEQCVRVRMTPILDFEQGVAKTFDEIMGIMGWIVGEPIGKTV